MSDGISEAWRDNDLSKIYEKIRNIEDKFKENESIDLAEEILKEFDVLKRMRRGYWKTINHKAIDEKISYYKEYIIKYRI